MLMILRAKNILKTVKNISLRKIPYQLTWVIRHKVMWPNKQLEYVKLKEDKFGLHYGLFIENELISTVSLFVDRKGKIAQFRKFATLEIYQGQGYGTMLMNHLMSELELMKVKRIWCNARVDKIGFYERFEMEETIKTFNKGGVEFVIMEKNIK